MSVRDEINALFAECKAEYGRLPYERGKVAPDEYTDAVFAILREALLSDAAVEAGALATHRYGLVPEDVPDAMVKSGLLWQRGRDRHYMPESRAALTAAVDAVLGGE